jgi:hypothetical protein
MDPSVKAQPMAEACVREALRRDLFDPPGRRRLLHHADTASARAGACLLCVRVRVRVRLARALRTKEENRQYPSDLQHVTD